MNPSKKLSQKRLQNYVLPRRKIDEEQEKFYEDNLPKGHFFYRRVTPDESERGELYPVWNAGIKTFAHFGIGVGIYFFQLLMLTFVYFISGMIMITAVYQFSHHGYGVDSNQPLLTISAACQAPTNVTATIGCPNGESECIASYRENCNLPMGAAFADLFMSLLFMIFIYIAKYFEKMIEEDLDEAVQTAQDYSLEVTDPNEDADNPDEWFEFFSKFGTVRYITVLRRNAQLTAHIAEKHKLVRKCEEMEAEIERIRNRTSPSCFDMLCTSSVQKCERQLHKWQQQIALDEAELKKELEDHHRVYPVCRVYVTFEKEEAQRKCVTDLEVADVDAILDRKQSGSGKEFIRFRGINTLNVVEPPEPDNIIWSNLEISDERRKIYHGIAFVVTLGLLVAAYFIIIESTKVSSIVLSVVIGFIDALLPNIFEVLTDLTCPRSEGKRQSDLQGKLFLARLLISTIFPYVQSHWREALTTGFIQQVINVQITACFTTTLLELIDFNGLITRHVVGPMFADTQAELNLYYSGMDWSLAAKYTGIAKILFLSLFYAILTPICLLIAMVAFGFLFLVDRFQLLRRWKPASMLDATIATRLRQQAILAAAAHMYVTMRFIYSWPMDEAWLVDAATQTYAYVDKYPKLNVFKYRHQPWHTLGQQYMLKPYKAGLCIVAAITFYIWVLHPAMKAYGKLFFKQVKIVGEVQGKNFSDISSDKKLNVYVPLVSCGEEKFLCFHNVNVLPQHMPSLLKASKEEKIDVSDYVRTEDRKRVLSIVKYYGTDVESHAQVKDGTRPSSANGHEPPAPSAATATNATPTEQPTAAAAAPSPVKPKPVIPPPLTYAPKPESTKPVANKQKRTVQNDYSSLPNNSPMKLPPLETKPNDIMTNLDDLYNAKKKARNLVKRSGGAAGGGGGGDLFHTNKKVHPYSVTSESNEGEGASAAAAAAATNGGGSVGGVNKSEAAASGEGKTSHK